MKRETEKGEGRAPLYVTVYQGAQPVQEGRPSVAQQSGHWELQNEKVHAPASTRKGSVPLYVPVYRDTQHVLRGPPYGKTATGCCQRITARRASETKLPKPLAQLQTGHPSSDSKPTPSQLR